jgi:sortase B
MKKQKPDRLFLICLVLLAVAMTVAISYIVVQRNRQKAYEALARQAARMETEAETETETERVSVTETETETEKTAPDIPVDFDMLQEENEDIYAWIYIPDTVVNYPILQSQGDMDVDYYLNYTPDGASGLPGSIYTQSNYNSGCFEDKVTVIYGHNMKNAMFGTLRDFRDEDFRKNHTEILIYTPEHIYTYRPVCAITYDNRHLLYYFDCNNDDYAYGRFLSSIQTERLIPSWVEEPFTVTTEDRMLILSTCNGNQEQRFLVGAVLVDEE